MENKGTVSQEMGDILEQKKLQTNDQNFVDLTEEYTLGMIRYNLLIQILTVNGALAVGTKARIDQEAQIVLNKMQETLREQELKSKTVGHKPEQ